jgi:hypothetical protein
MERRTKRGRECGIMERRDRGRKERKKGGREEHKSYSGKCYEKKTNQGELGMIPGSFKISIF